MTIPKSKLRVLLMDHALGLGGAERVVLNGLACSPALHVTLAAPPVQCELGRQLGFETVPFEYPPLSSSVSGQREFLAKALRLARLCKRRNKQLLYANSLRAMAYGLVVKMLGGPPLVAHIHCMLSKGDKRDILLRKSLQRWADLIIFPSTEAATYFKPQSKNRVIPNGIDLKVFRPAPDKAAAKRAWGLPEDSVVLGTIGRADPDKGMMPFLNLGSSIARTCPQTRFMICGGASFPHEEFHYNTVVQYAKEKLGDKVRLTGLIEDPVTALHAMDIMVHLSGHPEPLPTTALEAMACAVPVVGYRWGGIKEAIVDRKTGFLVAPENTYETEKAVMQLINDEALRAALGEAGKARCERLFSMERFVDELASALFHATQSPPKRINRIFIR